MNYVACQETHRMNAILYLIFSEIDDLEIFKWHRILCITLVDPTGSSRQKRISFNLSNLTYARQKKTLLLL